MKKEIKYFLVPFVVLLLIMSFVAACAPPPELPASGGANKNDANDIFSRIAKLKPVYVIEDNENTYTYGIYEFDSNGKKCTLVLDIMTFSADSNTVPALDCQ